METVTSVKKLESECLDFLRIIGKVLKFELNHDTPNLLERHSQYFTRFVFFPPKIQNIGECSEVLIVSDNFGERLVGIFLDALNSYW